jgi:hypothetical protein
MNNRKTHRLSLACPAVPIPQHRVAAWKACNDGHGKQNQNTKITEPDIGRFTRKGQNLPL